MSYYLQISKITIVTWLDKYEINAMPYNEKQF